MRRYDVIQAIGALILCASVALYSIALGGALLGVLTIAYGLASERQNMEPDE